MQRVRPIAPSAWTTWPLETRLQSSHASTGFTNTASPLGCLPTAPAPSAGRRSLRMLAQAAVALQVPATLHGLLPSMMIIVLRGNATRGWREAGRRALRSLAQAAVAHPIPAILHGLLPSMIIIVLRGTATRRRREHRALDDDLHPERMRRSLRDHSQADTFRHKVMRPWRGGCTRKKGVETAMAIPVATKPVVTEANLK